MGGEPSLRGKNMGKPVTLVGKQREIMDKAFDELGGIEFLKKWAMMVDDKGNHSNYKEFVKLYVRLVPPIKAETKDNKDTQEGFIMGLIKAENILKLSEGKPQEIIEVDAIEPESHV